jgi:hypothetical protein
MASEPYRKVGRGGAGNFYSKKDVEDASKTETSDLEAQKIPSTIDLASTPSSSQPPPQYLHTGRGGAGNFNIPSSNPPFLPTTDDPSLPVSSTSPPQNHSAILTTKEKAKENPHSNNGLSGYRGRGGVGNWNDADAGEKARAREEEEGIKMSVDERVRRDVEAMLRRPERAYGAPGAEDEY